MSLDPSDLDLVLDLVIHLIKGDLCNMTQLSVAVSDLEAGLD